MPLFMGTPLLLLTTHAVLVSGTSCYSSYATFTFGGVNDGIEEVAESNGRINYFQSASMRLTMRNASWDSVDTMNAELGDQTNYLYIMPDPGTGSCHTIVNIETEKYGGPLITTSLPAYVDVRLSSAQALTVGQYQICAAIGCPTSLVRGIDYVRLSPAYAFVWPFGPPSPPPSPEPSPPPTPPSWPPEPPLPPPSPEASGLNRCLVYSSNITASEQENSGCFTIGLLLLLLCLALGLCAIIGCCICTKGRLDRNNCGPGAMSTAAVIFLPCFDNLPSNDPLPATETALTKLKTSTPALVMRSICYFLPILIAGGALYLIYVWAQSGFQPSPLPPPPPPIVPSATP